MGRKVPVVRAVSERTAVLLFLPSLLTARGLRPKGYGMFSNALSVSVLLGLVLDPDVASHLARAPPDGGPDAVGAELGCRS